MPCRPPPKDENSSLRAAHHVQTAAAANVMGCAKTPRSAAFGIPYPCSGAVYAPDRTSAAYVVEDERLAVGIRSAPMPIAEIRSSGMSVAVTSDGTVSITSSENPASCTARA